MAASDRMAIFPSRANFVLIRQRIASAEKGLNLLKRKRDALEIFLKNILADLKTKSQNLEPSMQEAIFSLAKANFLGVDFKPASIVNPNRADAYLSIQYMKIVGMQVPTLDLVLKPTNALNLTGLGSGGQQVQIVRDKFQEALKCLVAVASLEYSVKVLSDAVKLTNMRVNALECVVLPRYQNTLAYIREELDEIEREDFYRLKRSQAKQLKKKSEFIKFIRNRQIETDVGNQGIDFTDTYLKTPISEVLATRGSRSVPESRRTVTKVRNKTIVLEQEKPIRFSQKPPQRLLEKKSKEIIAKKVVTSSSSDSDDN